MLPSGAGRGVLVISLLGGCAPVKTPPDSGAMPVSGPVPAADAGPATAPAPVADAGAAPVRVPAADAGLVAVPVPDADAGGAPVVVPGAGGGAGARPEARFVPRPAGACPDFAEGKITVHPAGVARDVQIWIS